MPGAKGCTVSAAAVADILPKPAKRLSAKMVGQPVNLPCPPQGRGFQPAPPSSWYVETLP